MLSNASMLIVEDHPLYRDGLVQLFSSSAPYAGIRVLTAESAEEGVRVVRQAVDLRFVLLDPGLRGARGAQAVALMCQACGEIPVLALSASDDRRDAAAALRAGARAFVSKGVPSDVLLRKVEELLAGNLGQGAWVTSSDAPGVVPERVPLTVRQKEILALLCQGHSNKEISLRLQLAEVTVKMHISAIFRVLEVATRTQAMAVAQRWGL